jgi:hypothetical protein
MCSTEFTVQAEFIVHSAGLSANSSDLSAKSADWRFHCSNFESNKFWLVFTEFYRIRPIFLKTSGIGGSRFFSLRRFFKHWSPAAAPLARCRPSSAPNPEHAAAAAQELASAALSSVGGPLPSLNPPPWRLLSQIRATSRRKPHGLPIPLPL